MDPLLASILLLLLSIVFFALEIFIPSGGVLGVLVVGSVIASIIVAFTGGIWLGATMLVVSALLFPILIGVAVKIWPNTPIGRRILIGRPSSEDVLPDGDEYRGLKQLVGRRGKAKIDMLPSGIVLIGGKEYDASSVGMPIQAGQTIEVVGIQTNHMVVRPAAGDLSDEQEQAAAETSDDVLSQPLESLGLDPFEDPLA